MPSNTTRAGLPYPLGTDPVADGDDAIKNLANRLDGSTGSQVSVPFAMAQGTATVSFSASTSAQVAITFPVGRFTVGPVVQQSILGTGLSNAYAPRQTSSPTTSGYTAVWGIATAGSGSISFAWLAIQMTSSSSIG